MAQVIQNQSGTFPGGSYEIMHRDTNTVLVLNLGGAKINAKPGSMISITEGTQIDGSFHFSFKNVFTGDQVAFLHLGGNGQAILSNHGLGDTIVLNVSPQYTPWVVNRHAFLCMTDNVKRESKAQSMGKAFGSGQGLWVHSYMGEGLLFLETFGAILFKDLQPGETYLIHHHFVVAWNCGYAVQPIQTSKGGFGGFMQKLATGDFWMCKFTGPGRVYFQSKSAEVFGEWISPYIPQGN
ncbi:tryptophan RNA-binding attenuator protein-like domain-containing protein, partial [Chytriomyces sp. MP71]